MRLKDKVAVITGAGSGIGKAIVEKLAQEGAKVVIADIDLATAELTVKEIQKKGHEAMAVSMDVTNEEQVILTLFLPIIFNLLNVSSSLGVNHVKKKFNWPVSLSFFPILLKKLKACRFFSWKDLRKQKNLMTFIFLSVAIGLLIRAYFLFYSVEYERKSAEFNKDAAVFAHNIRDKFHYNSEVISALQSYFNAAGVPSYEVFKKLADSYRENHKEIRALIWLPHVTESEREDFLHEAQKTFSSFQILDLQKDDRFLPSSPSSEYYPLYYIVPYEKNKIALGFNYLSNDERKKGIEKSRDSGEVMVTRPLKLIFQDETPVGFILMSPVYKQNQPIKTIEEKRKNILGIVAGVFKTSDVVNTLNPQDSEIFSISLRDLDAQRGKRILYSSENKKEIHPSNLWHYQEKINFGNNVWLLQLSPRDGYYTPKLQFLDIATLFIAFIIKN